MTKKDYIVIASAIDRVRQRYADYDGEIVADVLGNVVYELGQMFKLDNPRFDYNKFLERAKQSVVTHGNDNKTA